MTYNLFGKQNRYRSTNGQWFHRTLIKHQTITKGYKFTNGQRFPRTQIISKGCSLNFKKEREISFAFIVLAKDG